MRSAAGAGRDAPPAEAPPPRSLLRDSGFRRLFAAQTVSRWGDTFNVVALAVLVFDRSGSGAGVAGVVAAEIAPVLVAGPIAGLLVDRFPRVRVMVAADLWRMALALTLPFVDHRLAAIYLVAVGLSLGAVTFNPASQAVLPGLVPPERLVAANSALWSAAVVSQIALAPLAGLLVAAVGAGAAFVVNAATFLVSAVLLWRLPEPRDTAAVPTTPRRWTEQLREGLVALTARPLLRVLAGVQLLAALSAGATSALLVVLADEALGGGARSFGVLLAAIGVGAAAGPALLSRLTRDPGKAWLIAGPYALRGAVDLVLAAARSLPVAAGALTVYGVGTSTGAVTFTSLLQSRTAAGERGRVFAGFDVLWQTGRLVSLGLGGLAADAFGIRAVYALGGALLLVAAAVGGARLGPLLRPEA